MQYLKQKLAAAAAASSTTAAPAIPSSSAATTDSSNTANSGPRPLTKDSRKEIEIAHGNLLEEKKLKLSEGRYLEDIVYDIGKKYETEE